ncbi:hypothetical protein AVEN_187319-1 [Araneus ventricosus]|uniref:Ectonucleotide pyrophosphatase/phosphodiesterase family member 6 n=1 Tax=Araneus ventricosus TaxID=182803 RepID=A0A4Y2R060_ARAVE|nr:hypothetical protein AVEN_187319-1 [Araneus ventricosus]
MSGVKRKRNVLNVKQKLEILQKLHNGESDSTDAEGVLNEVNMVVLSDHGMTSTDSRGLSVINLNQLIDIADIRYMVYYGATSMLLPYEGKLEKICHQESPAPTTLHFWTKSKTLSHCVISMGKTFGQFAGNNHPTDFDNFFLIERLWRLDMSSNVVWRGGASSGVVLVI